MCLAVHVGQRVQWLRKFLATAWCIKTYLLLPLRCGAVCIRACVVFFFYLSLSLCISRLLILMSISKCRFQMRNRNWRVKINRNAIIVDSKTVMEFFSEAYIPQIQLIFASQRVHASCWHSAHYFNVCTKKKEDTLRERKKPK